MFKFFTKIKNWLIYGQYTLLYIVTYKYNNNINSTLVSANDEREAAFIVKHELNNSNSDASFKIIEVKEL